MGFGDVKFMGALGLYIPFGPFIVIACFISILVPFEYIFITLAKIFTLGMY